MKELKAKMNYEATGNYVSVNGIAGRISDDIVIELPDWINVGENEAGDVLLSFESEPENWALADEVLRVRNNSILIGDWTQMNGRDYGLKYRAVE